MEVMWLGGFRGLGVRRAFGRVRGSIPLLAAASAALLASAIDVAAQSEIVGWGLRVFDTAWNDEVFDEVAAGSSTSLARRSDGSVVAWGTNYYGQCDVPALPPGLAYEKVAVGHGICSAIRSDGSAVVWGDNGDGACDVPALPPGMTYVDVANGHSHCIAIRSDGSVVAWGDNGYGQCNAPGPGPTCVQVDGGNWHSVALYSDGSIAAWGDNQVGQCDVPSLPTGLTYVEVATGQFFSVARRSDGSLVAWGMNDYGQCDVPALPPGLTYVEVAAGGSHGLARRSDGLVVGWGANHAGQCDAPALSPGVSYVDIEAGTGYSLARLSDGSVVGWGDNANNRCGAPGIPAGLACVGVAQGLLHNLVRLSDGSIMAWGNNQWGECDVPVLPPGMVYVDIAAGGRHSLALRSDGSVAAFGSNYQGQCDVPALPPGLDYADLAAGAYHSLAVRSDGSVVTWGKNDYGQCDVPSLPPGMVCVEVSGSPRHSLARFSDGSLAAWGDNSHGQCDVPTLPLGLSYVGIAALNDHSLAIRSDGSVIAWGSNVYGEGDVPALPPGVTYVEVAGGDNYSLARRSDGSVVSWGDGEYRQCDVPALPPGFRYAEVSGGANYCIARYELGGGPTASVSNVTAHQRVDAGRFVDVYYDLDFCSGCTSSVSLNVSQDGGATFPILADGVFGDVGAGQTVGTGKHLVWNPSIDLPGVSGSNLVARVTADGGNHGESNIFSLSSASPGALVGTVRDEDTGSSISNALVSIVGGPSTTTNPQGTYRINAVPLGNQTLEASAVGYAVATLPVAVAGASTQHQDITLVSQPASGGIVDVRGKWCGPGLRTYYLDRIPLTETFTARVNWDLLLPGVVEWNTPNGTYIQPTVAGVAVRDFDMGSDFGPRGTMSVRAISDDDPPVLLGPYEVNFRVVSTPPPLSPLVLYAVPFSSRLEYTTPSVGFFQTDIEEGIGPEAIPPDVPLVGGQALKFGASLTASATVQGNGSGSASLFFGGPDLASGHGVAKKITVCGWSVQPSVTGSVDWTYNKGTDSWETGGSVMIGASASVSVPPAPFYFTVPPIPVPFFVRGEAGIGIAVGGAIKGWYPNGDPDLVARLQLDPFPRLEGAFGAGLYGIASVEGYIGGHARIVLESPPMPPQVTERVIFLGGGIRVISLVWHNEWPLAEWVCDLDGACPPFWDLSGDHPSFWDLSSSTSPQPLPRDYLVPIDRYAGFTANDNQAKSASSPGTIETVMQSNVFGQSTPTLVPIGPDRLAVWMYDDPTRTPTNRSELVWSFYDSVSQTWSAPAAVADDGTADFHPQLAVAPNGDVFAVWENIFQVLAEPVDPNDPHLQEVKHNEMRSKMDIVVTRFNPLSQMWSAPTVLVGNYGCRSVLT